MAAGLGAEAGPAGIPIGRALSIAPGLINDELRDAVAVVSRVHGDGVLPTIPLRFVTSMKVRGRLALRDETPSAILINHDMTHRAIAVFHEIGHFLDLSGAGAGRGFASMSSPLFSRWLLVAIGTRTFRLLDAGVQAALTRYADQPTMTTRLEMLRRPDELWARSYAQYVVRRSERSDLAAGIADLRIAMHDELALPLQWEDEEFDVIAAEIELLFRRMGWRSQ